MVWTQRKRDYRIRSYSLLINNVLSLQIAVNLSQPFTGCVIGRSKPIEKPCLYDSGWSTFSVLLHPSAGWLATATKAAVSLDVLERNLRNVTSLGVAPIFDDDRDHDTFGEAYTVLVSSMCIGSGPYISSVDPNFAPMASARLVTIEGPVIAPSFYHECVFWVNDTTSISTAARYDMLQHRMECAVPRWHSPTRFAMELSIGGLPSINR